MKSSFRKTIRTLHLWIGLATGIVVFIVCITGVLYTFQKELKLILYPHYTVSVTEEKLDPLPLDRILEAYQQYSDKKVLRIYDFMEASRSTILLSTEDNAYYYTFVNPYTGKVLYENALVQDFFTIVLYLHMNLLLGAIGTQIVGWSVFVFILSLISGLILWFPKRVQAFSSAKGRQSSFGIKTKGSKKRLLYDLHKILGFYGASILIVLAITGIAWTFTWVDTALYTAVTFEKKLKEETVVVDTTSFKSTALENLKQQIVSKRENKGHFIYFLPQTPTDPLWVRATPNDDQYGNTDDYYAKPDTGVLIKSKFDEDKNAGQKLNSLYYDIHTGSLLGIGGKIIVFLAGLIGASLPISGFLLYRHRRKKKKKKQKKKKNTSYSTVTESQKTVTPTSNTTEMNYKIAILWLCLGVGFVLHHVYGLAGIYFGKELVLEDATGVVPNWAHTYRILFELIILIFVLLTLEIEKRWFIYTAFVWSILLGLFNLYHCIEALLHESSNYSEIVLLVWMVGVNSILTRSLYQYSKGRNVSQIQR